MANHRLPNTDPFQPWNDPMHRDDPFAPHNDPMHRDDPSKPWNDPMGTSRDLDSSDRGRYGMDRRRTREEDLDHD